MAMLVTLGQDAGKLHGIYSRMGCTLAKNEKKFEILKLLSVPLE